MDERNKITYQDDSTIDQPLADWFMNFDPRQRKEILLALDYAQNYAHGTSGHMAYMVIARFATMVEKYARMEQEYNTPPPPAERIRIHSLDR